jgi:hypothetical protein
VPKRRKKKKRVGTFVKFVFKPRDHVSLAHALLGGVVSGSGGGRSSPDALPLYLEEMFTAIFADGDRSGDGLLSTIELMHLLQRRAQGTVLDGNSHAMFTLQELCEKQAAHGEIGVKEFSSGLHAAVVGDPNGAVAQWILKELQDEAAGWTAHVHDADDDTHATYYAHSKRGAKSTVWERPRVLVEMDRCSQTLSVDGAAEARRAARLEGTACV